MSVVDTVFVSGLTGNGSTVKPLANPSRVANFGGIVPPLGASNWAARGSPSLTIFPSLVSHNFSVAMNPEDSDLISFNSTAIQLTGL